MYYMLLSAGWVFGEAGIYPPLIGMWVPNVVMGSIGIYMLIRTARERPTKLELILKIYHRIRSRIDESGPN
jgi:lipopolysaccharide export system permease protein